MKSNKSFIQMSTPQGELINCVFYECEKTFRSNSPENTPLRDTL